MAKMPSLAEKKSWNKKVDRPVKLLKQVNTWLRLNKQSGYPWSWQDQVRLRRAQYYVQLAIVETKSLMYLSPEEVRNQKRDEFA